jgi:hypothetical protein
MRYSYTPLRGFWGAGHIGTWTYANWTYFDPYGGVHAYSGTSSTTTYTGCGQNWSQDTSFGETAQDGSGYSLSATGPCDQCSVYNSAGVSFNIQSGNQKTDRNGNITSSNGQGVFTDTLGQTALTIAGQAPNPVTFSYPAPSGANASYTVTYKSYVVRTNFGCSVNEFNSLGTTQYPLIDKITLPDASFYQFSYEITPGDTHAPHHVTGRLASVTLPTGGTISYTYTGGSSGHITCSDGSAAGIQRTTPDTPTGSYWNFVRSGTAPATTTTITDPTTAANVTVVQ